MTRTRLLLLAVIVIAAVLIVRYWLSTEQATSPAVEATPTPAPVGARSPAERMEGVRYDAQGVAIGGVEPSPSGGVPLDIDNIIASYDKAVIVSTDQRDTFTVPLPGDPRWPDYLEYRRAFRSVLDATPGFAVPYDPEWRAQLDGVRPTEDPGFELFGGDSTLRGLLQQVLDRLRDEDEQGLVDLAIRKEEFEIICWPAMPQSRPYLRYKWEDAWGFQYAGVLGGIKEGMRRAAGRALDLHSVAYDEIKDFGSFKLYRGVKINGLDPESGETIELDFVKSVIERNGIFKVYIYAD